MTRFNECWQVFPVSIKQLGLTVSILLLLMLGGFGWFAVSQVSALNEEMRDRNSILAEIELAVAIDKVKISADKVAHEFSQWDESIQQIHNPIYYNYWRDTRAAKANFVPNYYSNMEIYDADGVHILKQSNFKLLESIDPNNIDTQIAIVNGKYVLYATAAISNREKAEDSLGYVVVEFDLLALIDEMQKFSQLDYSTFHVKLEKNMLYSLSAIFQITAYSITPQPEFTALSKLVNDALIFVGVTVMLLFAIVVYLLFTLIAKPLSYLSKHIDDLSVGKLAYIKSDLSGLGIISEFSKLRVSLNYYIYQLENLEQVASGDLSAIAPLEYGKDVTGIMLSFNNVLKKLKETMEEKDSVSLQLTRQADELQKASDQAMYANKSKSAFLANTSHEIRTPLTAIIGFAEASLDEDLSNSERVDAIHTIIGSGKHLLQIINDILDLSKVEANKLDIEPIENVSPFQIMYDIEAFAKMHAKEKDLQFDTRFILPLPETITTDPVRLKQIVINLCNNAIKFTSSGSVQLIVSFDNEEKILNFSVVDTGIGLSQEQITKVFDPFTQADVSTTRRYGGTGLGLSLSKELAILLNGTLSVKSKVGAGSEFSLRIDMRDVQFDKFIYDYNFIPISTYQYKAAVTFEKLSGHVLVAEDNLENQRLLELYCRQWGVTATIVDNGQQAIDHAASNQYDIILMDLQMPVMGGIEAVKKLRSMAYVTPIVALTANAQKEYRDQCLASGFDDFLSKPIDRQCLYNVLRQHISVDENGGRRLIYSSLEKTDPEFMDLIEVYVGVLPDKIEEMRQAVDVKSWKTLEALAHDLRGVSGNYGFPSVSELAAKLEAQIKNEDYVEIDVCMEQLQKLQARVTVSSRCSSPDSKVG